MHILPARPLCCCAVLALLALLLWHLPAQAKRYEFEYFGKGRVSKIVEKDGGSATGTEQILSYDTAGNLAKRLLIGPADSDSDGMPDAWEIEFGLNPEVDDSELDPDGDGLSNRDEYEASTNPTVADTDGDGMPDGWELAYGFDPNFLPDALEDEDGDGFSNLSEYRAGTDPTDPLSVPPPPSANVYITPYLFLLMD